MPEKKKSPLTLLDSKFNMVQKSSSVAKHIMRIFFLFHEKNSFSTKHQREGGISTLNLNLKLLGKES